MNNISLHPKEHVSICIPSISNNSISDPRIHDDHDDRRNSIDEKNPERPHRDTLQDDTSIEIKEEKNNIPPVATPRTQRKDNCKDIVRNMLRSRSRNKIRQNYSTNNTPESQSDNKISPSLDRKPYEMGELGDPNLWTDETVQQIMDFGEICTESANKCKTSSIKHRRTGNFIQILVILLGALSAITSIGSVDDATKVVISMVTGSMVAILTSVQSFLKLPQKSEVEANSCLELERMARSVRIELSKAKEFRVDPYKYIIRLENQREKIIRRVGIEED